MATVTLDVTPGMLKPVVAKEINKAIIDFTEQGTLSTNDISDGYHTFGELYEHRITLWIALCQLQHNRFMHTNAPSVRSAWRTRLHSDGSGFEGWFVLGIGKTSGEQMTYHLPDSKWGLCDFAETLERAPDWDGHTSADVLERIAKLV
ncbi:hypothetical protein GCM10027299_21750 [Larkinella ripae]